MQYVIKLVLSALVIVLVSEVAKRHTILAALLASLPLTSFLAITWFYIDTKDIEKISELSNGIAMAVFPSLLFLIALPIFLKSGIKFAPAMLWSTLVLFSGYAVFIFILGRFGVKL